MATTKKKIDEVEVKVNHLNPANITIPEGFNLEETSILIDNSVTGESERYVPVDVRRAWYIQNNPNAPMPVTELVNDDNGVVKMKATLCNENGNVISTGYGVVCFAAYQDNIADAYLMAETQAVGRCLRNIGYGIVLGSSDGGDTPPSVAPITPLVPFAEAADAVDNAERSDDGENENKTVSELKDFETLTEVEKAKVVLTTAFPIKISAVGGVDLKGEQLYKVASAFKKAGVPTTKITSALDWGLEKKLVAIVNKEYNLTFPEFANYAKNLFSNVELYKKALKAIKEELYNK